MFVLILSNNCKINIYDKGIKIVNRNVLNTSIKFIITSHNVVSSIYVNYNKSTLRILYNLIAELVLHPV